MALETGLSADDKRELLRIARESVVAIVSGRKYSASHSGSQALNEKAGAFVTLHEKGELRGCIGFIDARLPVCEAVAETAAKAAASDPRFDAVTPSELEQIELEISVLSPLKRVTDLEEIIIGKHGVMVERGFYRGLLLPQVATENGWSRDEFLKYSCMKAGLDGGCYKDAGTRISIFSAEVFSEKECGLIPDAGIGEESL